MSNINFEEDQQDLVDKTASIQSLADQIQMLEGLNNRIEISEDNLKNLKKEHDRLSGEVIPTMMAEMGLAHLKLSDGSSKTIDTTGTMHRWLYKITASFTNVKEVEWAKIQDLIAWQDMGYKITIHPFLPGVPHCLVGEFLVNNINKSLWDLTRFSFQLVFTESE